MSKLYNFISLMKDKLYRIKQSAKYPVLCVSLCTIDITNQIQCIYIIVKKNYKLTF